MLTDIKVIILDDHPVIREGIKSSLEAMEGITVPGEAETGNELFEKLEQTLFDIILLDLTLTGKSGLDILADLKARKINIPVLVFSVNPEKDYAIRVLKAGAKGYISKQADTEEIARAIKKIVSGQSYMSDTVQEQMRQYMIEGKNGPLHETLSNREFQVMLLISRGRSNQEIGNQLNISDKTASTYRYRIYDKMCFSNDAELIKYVITHNLDPG